MPPAVDLKNQGKLFPSLHYHCGRGTKKYVNFGDKLEKYIGVILLRAQRTKGKLVPTTHL